MELELFLHKCTVLVKAAGLSDRVKSMEQFKTLAPTILLLSYAAIYENAHELVDAAQAGAVVHSRDELRRSTLYGVKELQKIDIIINSLSRVTKHSLLDTVSGRDVCLGNEQAIGIMVGILYSEGNRLRALAQQRKLNLEAKAAARRAKVHHTYKEKLFSKLVPNSTDNPRNPFLGHILLREMRNLRENTGANAASAGAIQSGGLHPLVVSPDSHEIPGLGLEMVKRLRHVWQEGTEIDARSRGTVSSARSSQQSVSHDKEDWENQMDAGKDSARRDSANCSDCEWDDEDERREKKSKAIRKGSNGKHDKSKSGSGGKDHAPGKKKKFKDVKSFGPLHLRRPLSAPVIHCPKRGATLTVPPKKTVAAESQTPVATAYDLDGRKKMLDAAAVKARDEEAARMRDAIENGTGIDSSSAPARNRKNDNPKQRPAWPGAKTGQSAEEWVKRSRLAVLTRMVGPGLMSGAVDVEEVGVPRAGALAGVIESILRDPAVASSLSTQQEEVKEDSMIRALMHGQGDAYGGTATAAGNQGSLERGDILLVVEHCHSCTSHSTTMRHCEGEYLKRAVKVLKLAAREVHSACVCIRLGVAAYPARLGKSRDERSPSPPASLRSATPAAPSAATPSGCGATPVVKAAHPAPWGSPAGHDARRGRVGLHAEIDSSQQGRIGAFELHILYRSQKTGHISNQLLHSKLRTQQWPSQALLASKIKTFLIKENVPTFYQEDIGAEIGEALLGEYADVAIDSSGSTYPVGTGPFDATPLGAADWTLPEAILNVTRTRRRRGPRSPSTTAVFNAVDSAAADTNPTAASYVAPGVIQVNEEEALLTLPLMQYAFDSRRATPIERFELGCVVRVFYLPHPRGRAERFGLLGVVKDIKDGQDGAADASDGSRTAITGTRLRVRLKYHHSEIEVDASQCTREDAGNAGEKQSDVAQPPKELALLFFLLNSVQSGSKRAGGSPSGNAAVSVWKVMDKGDREFQVPVENGTAIKCVCLTRASLFHQLRNLSWDLETKFAGPRGGLVENTLARKVTQGTAGGSVVSRGVMVDLQICYGEDSLDWIVRFARLAGAGAGEGCDMAALEEYIRSSGTSLPNLSSLSFMHVESATEFESDEPQSQAQVQAQPETNESDKVFAAADADHEEKKENFLATATGEVEQVAHGLLQPVDGADPETNGAEEYDDAGAYEDDAFDDEGGGSREQEDGEADIAVATKDPAGVPPGVEAQGDKGMAGQREQHGAREDEDDYGDELHADEGNEVEGDREAAIAASLRDDRQEDEQQKPILPPFSVVGGALSDPIAAGEGDDEETTADAPTSIPPLKSTPSIAVVLSNYLSSSGAGSDSGSDDMDADAIALLMGGSPTAAKKDEEGREKDQFQVVGTNSHSTVLKKEVDEGEGDDLYGDEQFEGD